MVQDQCKGGLVFYFVIDDDLFVFQVDWQVFEVSVW